jgi:hypothetical protein
MRETASIGLPLRIVAPARPRAFVRIVAPPGLVSRRLEKGFDISVGALEGEKRVTKVPFGVGGTHVSLLRAVSGPRCFAPSGETLAQF